MRLIPSFVILASAAAAAQNISGTFTATYTSSDMYGKPTVHLDLELMCSLSCPASAPDLHYGLSAGVSGSYASAPMESVGYVGSGFGTAASNVDDNTSFGPGSAFKLLAKSCTCWCGNATGQGGYVDLTTQVVAVPPFIFTGILTPSSGQEWTQIINASPRGTETVDVHFSGAGVDVVQHMAVTDFSSSGAGSVKVTPTQGGTMTVTATLQPYGASSSAMLTVAGGNGGGSGGGSGTGGSGTGGGSSGTGGGAMPSGGCSAAPALGLLPLGVLALLKARRRRS